MGQNWVGGSDLRTGPAIHLLWYIWSHTYSTLPLSIVMGQDWLGGSDLKDRPCYKQLDGSALGWRSRPYTGPAIHLLWYLWSHTAHCHYNRDEGWEVRTLGQALLYTCCAISGHTQHTAITHLDEGWEVRTLGQALLYTCCAISGHTQHTAITHLDEGWEVRTLGQALLYTRCAVSGHTQLTAVYV